MSEEKLLTVREVSTLLNISEKDVMNLAEAGLIPAYKVGGVFVRFKKEQVENYKKTLRPHPSVTKVSPKDEYPFKEKIIDFLYFNDFYIFAGILASVLVAIILLGN